MATTMKQQQPKRNVGKAEEQAVEPVLEVTKETPDPLDECRNQAERAYTTRRSSDPFDYIQL